METVPNVMKPHKLEPLLTQVQHTTSHTEPMFTESAGVIVLRVNRHMHCSVSVYGSQGRRE